MLQAFTSPVGRSILLGGIVLALGGAYVGTRSTPVTRRLALHAVEEPNAFYLSAWRNGDIVVRFGDAKLVPIVFKTRARVYDGCRWLGTETLTPIDDKSYVYAYSETILECDPGAVPLRKTPRVGLVTVEDGPRP